MKVLIAYCSVSGTAKGCAELLSRELFSADVTVADLASETPDVGDYDVIVLGAPIRMNKFGKPFRNYVGANADALKNKPHGFFVCAMSEESFEERVPALIPKELRDSAFAVEYFGGELSVERQKSFFARLITRVMRDRITSDYGTNDAESDTALPTIAEPVIAQYAQKVMKAVENTTQK